MDNLEKRKELFQQYDRFIKQAQSEIGEVYWIFNSFFVANTGFLALVFWDKVNPSFIGHIKWIGFFLSFFWFISLRKQMLWRNHWIKRVKNLETNKYLNMGSDLHFWHHVEDCEDYFSKFWKAINPCQKEGLWTLLCFFPFIFFLVWLLFVTEFFKI